MEDGAAARMSQTPPGFRRGLAALWIALAVSGLALALAAGPLWYYSDQIVAKLRAKPLAQSDWRTISIRTYSSCSSTR